MTAARWRGPMASNHQLSLGSSWTVAPTGEEKEEEEDEEQNRKRGREEDDEEEEEEEEEEEKEIDNDDLIWNDPSTLLINYLS
jgi:hypothetical protein